MRKESLLTKAKWMETDFPVHPLPKETKGVVNIECSETKVQELLSENNVNWGFVRIMKEGLGQLVNGASSQVEPPGTALTRTDNWFSDPPQQLPRVVDALASFTKNEKRMTTLSSVANHTGTAELRPRLLSNNQSFP